MSDGKLLADIESAKGRPDLILTPTEAEITEQGMTDDIAKEYRLYFDKAAAGGCVVFGLYDQGWIVNPSARWPMAEMARRLLNSERV